MASKPHILFFCPYLDSGGAELHLVRLVLSLDAKAYRKTVVVCQRGGSYERLLEHDEVELISLEKRARRSSIRMLSSVWPLAKLIRRLDPDAVFSIMDYANVFCLIGHGLARHRSKTIVDVQTSLIKSLEFAPSLFGRVVFFLMNRMYPKADRILCLSQGVADELQNALLATRREQYAVIHNIGVEVEPDSVLPAKKRGQICVCGRLVPLKGFDLVITALATVKTRFPEANLVIMGDGPDKAKLQRLASGLGIDDSVKFLGFIPEAHRIMAESAILVVSSYYEGFGNVIVEAMASGTPVVSTDCPYGPGEIIESDCNGLLVKVGDAAGIAQALEELLENSDLYNRIQDNGRRRAQDFSPNRIAKLHHELLLSVLESAPLL